MIRLFTALLTVSVLTQPVYAASTALDAVKETANAVLATLRDPKFQGDRTQREEQIKNLVRSRFDFEEMARRSLGPHWANQSPADQQQFVRRFTDLLIDTYIGRIDEYKGEKIIYEGERRDGNAAAVNTKVFDAKGQPYSLNYRLQAQNGDWKIYDVVVEDVSIVNNYRSQFARVLNRASFADLLQMLASKKFNAPAGAS